mgnify:CR=1 FL=1
MTEAVRHYEVGDSEKLIYSVSDESLPVRYYVYTEQIFNIIHETHSATGHRRRTRILKELQKEMKKSPSRRNCVN